MSNNTTELSISFQTKTNEKRIRKLTGVLRRLAKSDSSVMNAIKVTVCEGEITEEKNEIFIAPSIIMNYRKYTADNYLSENIRNNIFSDLKEIESKHDNEEIGSPDSSDFDDDDE